MAQYTNFADQVQTLNNYFLSCWPDHEISLGLGLILIWLPAKLLYIMERFNPQSVVTCWASVSYSHLLTYIT